MVCAAENRLRKIDIQRKQRIGIFAVNSVEYVIVLLALWRIGAIACLLSPRFPKATVNLLTKKIHCTRILTEKDFSLSWRVSPEVRRSNPLKIDRAATILFTSGTTAVPKAVLHTYANHFYSAKGANLNIRLGPNDRWLLSLPLYHVGGLAILFRVFLAGSTLVIASQGTQIQEAILHSGVTHVSLVQTQLYRLLSKKRGINALSKFKAILLGGSVIGESIIKKAVTLRLPIYTTYGSTEMASQVTTTRKNDSLKRLQTSGKILKYRQIRIMNDYEIFLKGKTLCQGYVEGNRLRSPTTSDGWFPTGDLGRFDAEKYLTVWGRKDNMFISGGENIYPEEIESELYKMKGIQEAMVVPVKNDEFVYRPVTLIKVSSSTHFSHAQLTRYLKKHLPRFKIPETFFVWPEQTDFDSIKVDRKFLTNLVTTHAHDLKRLS